MHDSLTLRTHAHTGRVYIWLIYSITINNWDLTTLFTCKTNRTDNERVTSVQEAPFLPTTLHFHLITTPEFYISSISHDNQLHFFNPGVKKNKKKLYILGHWRISNITFRRETRVPSFPHTVKHIFKRMHEQESCRSILTFPEARVNNRRRQSCQHSLITVAFTISYPRWMKKLQFCYLQNCQDKQCVGKILLTLKTLHYVCSNVKGWMLLFILFLHYNRCACSAQRGQTPAGKNGNNNNNKSFTVCRLGFFFQRHVF